MTFEIESMTVGLPVTEMSKAIEWYQRLLGKCKMINPAPGVVEFELKSGFWLQLFESQSFAYSQSIVRIGVTNIQREHERIRSLGIGVSSIETVLGVVSYFNFKDPFGNRLGIYEVL